MPYFKSGDKVLVLDNENKTLIGKSGTIVEVKDDASGNVVFHKVLIEYDEQRGPWEIAVHKTTIICDDPNCLQLTSRVA